MKKHLIFISVTLLTIAPIKLICMEENKHTIQQIEFLQATSKLYNLANIPEKDDVQNLLSALPNFINTTENQSDLRDGIFALTTLLTIAPHEKKSELKIIRTSMYNRLTEILLKNKKQFPTTKEAKNGAKEFCYGIYSSDDEDTNEKNNYTQNNFIRYQNITNKIQEINKKQNRCIKSSTSLEVTKKLNEAFIETLEEGLKEAQKRNAELAEEITRNQKKGDVLKTAHNLLQNKASNQFEKIQKQKKYLVNEINNINNSITQLQKELAALVSNNEDSAQKNREITNAREKLDQLQSALSDLDKNFGKIEEKKGSSENPAILLLMMLNNLSNILNALELDPNQDTKKN